MATERKIIDVGKSAPLLVKGKKRKMYITLASLLVFLAVLVMIMVISTGDKTRVIGSFVLNEVESGPLSLSTEASGSVVLPTQVSITAMEEGYASELFVMEGDSITTETVLAVLYVPELEKSRDDVRNSLITAELDLEEIELNHRYAILNYEKDLVRLEEDIFQGLLDVDAALELAQLKSSRLSDYETALDALENLEEQKEDLEIVLERERKSGEIAVKKQKAQIGQLQVTLQRLEADISAARITSPIDGDVLSLNEVLTVPGSLIEQSSQLFTIADTDDVYIDLEVYEQYSSALTVGGAVDLIISSRPVSAEVTHVGSIASMSSDGLAATVTVRVRPLEGIELTPGASAVAVITLGTKEKALLLPRGPYLTTGNQRYVYKVEGNQAYKRTVTYGEIQGTQVEIMSGLDEGDRIITSSYQNFIDEDVIELKEE